jgi:hypothetical protein
MSIIKGKVHIRRIKTGCYLQMAIPEPYASILLEKGDLDQIGFIELIVGSKELKTVENDVMGMSNSEVSIKYLNNNPDNPY